jgi:hypothetical protein
MNKTLEIILIFFLAIFSFCLGVKYSDDVKDKAGWMFEVNEEEVLPDLVNPENPEIEIQMEENSPIDEQNAVPLEDEMFPTNVATQPTE